MRKNLIITEKQMNLIVDNLLNEAVGVPEYIIDSAEELYEIIANQLKRMNDYETKQEFSVGGLNLKISDYTINELELRRTRIMGIGCKIKSKFYRNI
jgi:hypothetical protein